MNNVLTTALFYCCDADLCMDLMRDIRGDVATMLEGDLLVAIQKLTVIDESTLVHLEHAYEHSWLDYADRLYVST
jgi:hypothetical protein